MSLVSEQLRDLDKATDSVFGNSTYGQYYDIISSLMTR